MQNINNQEINNYLIETIVKAFINFQKIDPNAKNLIADFGSGNEQSNQEAIKFWVYMHLQQMVSMEGSLICLLREDFENEVSIHQTTH